MTACFCALDQTLSPLRNPARLICAFNAIQVSARIRPTTAPRAHAKGRSRRVKACWRASGEPRITLFPDATVTYEATIMPVSRCLALSNACFRAPALRRPEGRVDPTRNAAHAATADEPYSALCSSATFRQRSPNTRMQVYVRLTHSAMCSTSATNGDVPSSVQTISSASQGCSSSYAACSCSQRMLDLRDAAGKLSAYNTLSYTRCAHSPVAPSTAQLVAAMPAASVSRPLT